MTVGTSEFHLSPESSVLTSDTCLAQLPEAMI